MLTLSCHAAKLAKKKECIEGRDGNKATSHIKLVCEGWVGCLPFVDPFLFRYHSFTRAYTVAFPIPPSAKGPLHSYHNT